MPVFSTKPGFGTLLPTRVRRNCPGRPIGGQLLLVRLFAATAAAFGRRAIHIDLAIGLVLGTAAYLMFAKLLSLSLPMGPVERLLGG